MARLATPFISSGVYGLKIRTQALIEAEDAEQEGVGDDLDGLDAKVRFHRRVVRFKP
jgi:hypothetical protein